MDYPTSPYPRQPLPPQNTPRRMAFGPDSTMSMEQIATIFAGEGNTPRDAAMRIQSTWSPEARNVLNKSWERTGISQFPEDYFQRAINQTKAEQMAALYAQQKAQPTIDPVEQRLNLGRQIAGQRFATNARAVQDPLRNQLRGDVFGDVKKVLRSRSIAAGSPDAILPYASAKGVSNADTYSDGLDDNLLNDGMFLRLLQEDPRRASFVYERLTGRSMDSDQQVRSELRKKEAEVASARVQDRIDKGMQFNQYDGQYYVPQEVEVASSVAGKPTKEIRMVPLSPTLQNEFSRYAPKVMNREFKMAPAEERKRYQFVESQARERLAGPDGSDRDGLYAAYKQKVDQFENDTAQAAGPDDRRRILNLIEKQQAPKPPGFWENLGSLGSWISGEVVKPIMDKVGIDSLYTNNSDGTSPTFSRLWERNPAPMPEIGRVSDVEAEIRARQKQKDMMELLQGLQYMQGIESIIQPRY